MAELKEKAREFPTEDIGVAQGNSLSPLLGNIILADFDNAMNQGDCRCIRYIDDFVILAPSERAANARLRKAVDLLKGLQMELSAEKSSRRALFVLEGFDFLGVNISAGKIRPAERARTKFLASIEGAFDDGKKAFIAARNGQTLPRSQSLLATLKRVDGIINGWGKHYWFCNDDELFTLLDRRLVELIRKFLGAYRDIRQSLPPSRQQIMLGLAELSKMPREPFAYPSISNSAPGQ